MKQEQTLLSLEAHDCANAVPDLSKMIGAVQTLGNIHQLHCCKGFRAFKMKKFVSIFFLLQLHSVKILN